MVLKLHKTLTEYEDEYLSDSEGGKSIQSGMPINDQAVSDAVAFEPFFLTSLMVHHWSVEFVAKFTFTAVVQRSNLDFDRLSYMSDDFRFPFPEAIALRNVGESKA